MSRSALLQAIHKSDEILREHCHLRPDVPVDENAATRLGRNSTTQIHDTSIRRHAIDVFWEDESLKIKYHDPEYQSTFFVNGKQLSLLPSHSSWRLHNGDVIGLSASQDGTIRYEYKVVITDSTTTENTAAAANLTTSCCDGDHHQQHDSLKRSAWERSAWEIWNDDDDDDDAANNNNSNKKRKLHTVTEDCFCALCLDVQVQATLLVPCGHSFCLECGQTVTECPTCRQVITGRVANRALANVISAMANHDDDDDHAAFFPADDLEHYKKRVQAAEKKQQQQSPKKRSPRKKPARRRGAAAAALSAVGAASAASAASAAAAAAAGGGTSAADAICID